MAKLVMTVEQMGDQAAWLAMRNKGLGGSDIATVMGLNKYKARLRLWLEKTGQLDEEDLSDNQYVRFGQKFEPVLAECFTEDTGLKVRRVGLMQHDDHPWALASIDRMIVGQNELLEIKTGGAFTGKNWDGDEIPDSYYCQVQWYLFVSGCERAHIYCLIGGNKPIYKIVERNEDDIKRIFEDAKEFWHKVENNIMPDIDGHEDTGELLEERYQAGYGGQVSLSSDIGKLLVDREAYEKDIAVLTAAVAEIDNKIKFEMGNFETAKVGDRKITWKLYGGKKTIDIALLQTELPEVYNKYLKIGIPYRKFEIKVVKNNG